MRPFPIANLKHILAMASHIAPMLDELVPQELFEMPGDVPQPLDPIEDIARQVKPVELIEHRHIERRGRGAFFLVTSNVEIRVICSPVG